MFSLQGQFFREKRELFGEIYRTHLFGKPTIRITGKDNVRKILYGENKIVKSAYPASVRKLAGPNSLTMSSGQEHDRRRKYLMQFLRTDFVNQHVSGLSVFMMERLQQWSEQPSIDIFNETKTLITEISAKFLISPEIDSSLTKRLVPLYDDFTKNLFSLPINLPGFGFHKVCSTWLFSTCYIFGIYYCVVYILHSVLFIHCVNFTVKILPRTNNGYGTFCWKEWKNTQMYAKICFFYIIWVKFNVCFRL